MRTVWKFTIPLHSKARDTLSFDAPAGAEPTLVGIDPATGDIGIWLEVETDRPKELRTFSVVGTGHRVPADWRRAGSVIDGQFVWHVYEAPL
jgi:hypothetical protein